MAGLTDIIPPKITLMSIDTLQPYALNSRTHSLPQVEQLAASLLKFGWTNPVLADDKGIVAGHGRVMGAAEVYRQGKQIHFPDGTPIPIGQIPVLDVSGWDDARRRAYIIADNKLALNAGWDEELLKVEIKALDALDFDLDVIGFNEDELAELLAELPEVNTDADPDDIPEVTQPQSFLGDVWVCGPHRICCGDATNPNDWDKLMQGERADLCITDPPYNVDLGLKNRRMDKAVGGIRDANGSIANDKMSDEEFKTLLEGTYANLFSVLKPGATLYIAHSDKCGGVFRELFEAAGFTFSQNIIWRKNQLVLGMAPYQPIHEPIIYGRKPGSKHKWFGGRKQTTVVDLGEGPLIRQDEEGRWLVKVGDAVLVVSGEAMLEEMPTSMLTVAKPAKNGLHPSTKPVELWERLISNSCRAGDLLVDAFSGSGTTIIAADRLGMCARVMELDPKYVDTAVRRWQNYTGRTATHFVTGEPFPDEGTIRDNPSTPLGEGDKF
ncbi:site-specific DNA-methyltransferase [Salmonella enterica]|nr:site-specific DNA-methyltransferase [Salmonella enterica]EAR6391500.1 site-specific DNA-methyltransferase [Salmonella enterica]EAV1285264.1 site-specific DNA-methyltransferase [Salmonella enterica]ECC2205796.1 site-specific DNA-methyltransferase [Salmonella enterica]